jgi:hypothetical protein
MRRFLKRGIYFLEIRLILNQKLKKDLRLSNYKKNLKYQKIFKKIFSNFEFKITNKS